MNYFQILDSKNQKLLDQKSCLNIINTFLVHREI